MMRAATYRESERARWAEGLSLILAVAIAGTPAMALAATPASEQGPISTAPSLGPAAAGLPAPQFSPKAAATKPLTTNEQITAFIRSAPPMPWRNDAPLADTDTQLRQVHGQVGVAVGTGGYRSAYAQADIPIGRTGLLSVAVAETRSDRLHGGYSAYDYDPLHGRGFAGYGGALASGRGVSQSFGLSFQLGDGAGRGGCERAAASRQRGRAETWVRRNDLCADPAYGRPRH